MQKMSMNIFQEYPGQSVGHLHRNILRLLAQSISTITTTILWPSVRNYSEEPVPEEKWHCRPSSSGFYGAREDNKSRCADNLAGCHSIWTIQWPVIIPPFLHWMPFLSQPSQFILASDRHQICWLAYPVVWSWPPYVIGQAIIFLPGGFFLLFLLA